MEKYLDKVKTRRNDLFLKLVKKISKPDYTMHFMEDRYGRRAMFYNYKGVEIQKDDCVLLKATIAEYRYDRYNNKPLTYLNRVTVRQNRGSKENPKTVFGEEGIERGSSSKEWEEPLTSNNEKDLDNVSN